MTRKQGSAFVVTTQYTAFVALVVADLELDKITIPIKFVNDMVDYKKNALGFEAKGYITYNPRKGYDIQIRTGMNLFNTCMTTAHELRHVYQHYHAMWRGFTWKKKRISRNTPYEQLPWEIDADLYSKKKTAIFMNIVGIRA